MIPVNVSVQFIRDGAKETARLTLSMDWTTHQAVVHIATTLRLSQTDPANFQLLRQRMVLRGDQKLFEVGIQEHDILQLVAADPNATTAGQVMAGNIFSRMGGKQGGGDPLPISAALFTRAGAAFVLRRTRSLVGRADPALGITPDMLDADLTELDTNLSVSRPHALIVNANGEFTVRDLYSQRGVKLNGVALPANTAHTVKDSDWLIFGEVELQFRCG